MGEVAAGTLGLSISRSIDGGIHEDLDITNHGQAKVQFNLEIVIRSDFADLFEVKSGDIVRRGRITTSWSQGRARLTTTYCNDGFVRTVTIAPASAIPAGLRQRADQLRDRARAGRHVA